MNIIIIFIFCFSLIQAEDSEDISFRYGLLGHLESNPDSTVELSDSSIIYTGEEIIINVGYVRKSYFYLIYMDSEEKYDFRVPSNESQQDTIYHNGIMAGRLLDPPGMETFYVINSRTPLNELAKLITRYENVPPKGRSKLARKIQYQLNVLNPNAKAKLSSITSRLEKPLVGGVTFRGDDDDELKDMSLTHECKGNGGVAFQKIVLNHQ